MQRCVALYWCCYSSTFSMKFYDNPNKSERRRRRKKTEPVNSLQMNKVQDFHYIYTYIYRWVALAATTKHIVHWHYVQSMFAVISLLYFCCVNLSQRQFYIIPSVFHLICHSIYVTCIYAMLCHPCRSALRYATYLLIGRRKSWQEWELLMMIEHLKKKKEIPSPPPPHENYE